MKLTKIFLTSGALALIGISQASANIIVTFFPPPLGAGPYTFNYGVNVTADQKIVTGNFFTIYDFAGFTGTTAQPAGWTFTSSLLGVNPPFVAPADDPTIPNLTFTYTGSTITGPFVLGVFSADSTLNTTTTDNFASLATKNAPGTLEDNTPVSNIGTTTVPSVPTVPDSASTVLLLGGALGTLGLLRRRFSK